MTIKSWFYFEDNKLWVENQTWNDLMGSQSPVALSGLKVAAAEVIARGGAFIIYDKSVGIMRRCDRGPELEALMQDIDVARHQLGLQPL